MAKNFNNKNGANTNKSENSNGGKKSFNNNGKSGGGKAFSKPEPVIDPVSIELANLLIPQIEAFLSYDGSDFRERDMSLFKLDYPTYFVPSDATTEAQIEDKALDLFVCRRSVLTDRETNALRKAYCDIICLYSNDRQPGFFINAFINADGRATIEVVPQGEKGPRFRDTYRWRNFTRTPVAK